MTTRRHFLGSLGASIATPVLAPLNIDSLAELVKHHETSSASALSRDEEFWTEIQKAFTVDRSLVNLNNGGVSPAPSVVQEAMKKHLDFSQQCPVHNMWRILEPRREGVRQQLARKFGCDSEEIAIVRNASEGLQICQLGIDLERGDEVLTSLHDYPRMITTFKQRERREGIVLKQFALPVPVEDDEIVVRLFEENITPRTKLILMSHIVNITGQILPVKKVVQMARKRGIPVIVDGAHSFAHFDFKHEDLDCDYFATSLHKWLFAPHGTGMLYVRKDKIKGVWPMMAAVEAKDGDIRKFEEIGTHPAANFISISEALTFDQTLGPKRKEERLRYLRNYWAERLLQNDRIYLNTSLIPKYSCCIANVGIEGIDCVEIGSHLWKKHQIITTPIPREDFKGLRITPSVYTTLDELDRFCDAMEEVAVNGL